ncbi:MAG: M20/M25/M40 family metallo-hydrolase [Betaproteobacteria bacterium]|nr:M20/M25/M40 family metallo-hydrolase [Betaproteobacteria bacterium]
MSVTDDAIARIDRQELTDLALAICNIDSAGPTEAPVAEYLYDWLVKEGFRSRKIGLLADRYNVLGTLSGTGGGYSLIFNSHMDTVVRHSDVWATNNPSADIYHKAWVDGEDLVGEGIVNDKGPMAAFLIAAKAVKATGVLLKGDLLVSGVVAETSHEPSDGPPGEVIESKDLGARFLATHGGVADYALVAEGTGFSVVSVEAGIAWFKLTWISDAPRYYGPYLPDRTTMRESPNMIVRAAYAVEILERWGTDYQLKYSYQSSGGPVVPKVFVGAVRGGDPTGISAAPQVCSLYLGAFTVPDHNPMDLKEEISETLKAAGVPATEIDLYHFRRGYEARNVERLKDALVRAHVATFGSPPPPPHAPTCSMWRDVNIFNELGIPCITYGPRANYPKELSISKKAMYDTACVYVRTIVDLCNQEKPRPGPRSR